MNREGLFESDECNRLFLLWLSNFPESFHSADMDRFTELVICLLDNDEDLTKGKIIESSENLDINTIDYYFERFLSMKEIYSKLKFRWIKD